MLVKTIISQRLENNQEGQVIINPSIGLVIPIASTAFTFNVSCFVYEDNISEVLKTIQIELFENDDLIFDTGASPVPNDLFLEIIDNTVNFNATIQNLLIDSTNEYRYTVKVNEDIKVNDIIPIHVAKK